MASESSMLLTKSIGQLLLTINEAKTHEIYPSTPTNSKITLLRNLKPGYYTNLPKWVSHGFIVYKSRSQPNPEDASKTTPRNPIENQTLLSYSTFRNFQHKYTSSPFNSRVKESVVVTIREEYSRIEERPFCDFNTNINIDHTLWLSHFESTHGAANLDNIIHLALDTTRLSCCRTYDLIEKIQQLTIHMLQKIVAHKSLTFQVDKSQCRSNLTFRNDVVSRKKKGRHTKLIGFYTKQSGHHFSVMMFLLSEIHKLLTLGSNATKREIYYLKTTFLKNQNALTRALQDLCVILDVNPWELAIHSSAKGIMVGNIVINSNDGEQYDFRQFSNGLVLPNDIMSIKSIETDATFILVVEKDTIFHRLLNDKIFGRIKQNFIMITAKGYPDINSRWILKKIWNDFQIPMFILVDSDPHGIEIMCTYKYGSMAMAQYSDSLALPALKWIGIHPTDIEALCLNIIPLNAEDYKRIDSLLNRTYIGEEIKNELVCLKNLNCKCELEALYSLSANFMIEAYITKQIHKALNDIEINDLTKTTSKYS